MKPKPFDLIDADTWVDEVPRGDTPMNDEAMKWVTELEKAAKIRTPVGATYAVALALMHVASAIEKHTAAARDADLEPAKAKK